MMEFKDFIGVQDFCDLDGYCKDVIAAFKDLQRQDKVYDRQQERPESTNLMYSGDVVFLEEHPETAGLAQYFSDHFWVNAYKSYAKKYPILNGFDYHTVYSYKVQKTVPGEGYHEWHVENCCNATRDRILVWTLYLNDVAEGGETEFLHQAIRVKPKAGRLAIWPAGLTHVHRGNQPLSGEKYLMTGWVVYKEERN